MGRAARLPDRPHRALGRLVAAHPLRGHPCDRARRRALLLDADHRRPPRGRPRDRARARPADRLRPARARVVAPPPAALVRAAGGREARAGDQGAVPLAHRRLHRRGPRRRGDRLRAADPVAGHRRAHGHPQRPGRRLHGLGAGTARAGPDRHPAAPALPRGAVRLLDRDHRGPPAPPARRPHHRAAPERGRRRAGAGLPRARHLPAPDHRRHRHDVVVDRLRAVAPRAAPRRPPPPRRRAGPASRRRSRSSCGPTRR